MNGIKMSDCKFYVNEEARTVVCVIPPKLSNHRYVSSMLLDFIDDHFGFNDLDFRYVLRNDWTDRELEMPNSFIGKAVCAPEDEWNEETGRMIAFSRAKDKCYSSFFRRANKLVQAVDLRLGDMTTIFNNFGKKLEEKKTALSIQIDERTKG